METCSRCVPWVIIGASGAKFVNLHTQLQVKWNKGDTTIFEKEWTTIWKYQWNEPVHRDGGIWLEKTWSCILQHRLWSPMMIELPLFAGETVVTTMQSPFSKIVPLSKSIEKGYSIPTRNLCTYYRHAISEFYIIYITNELTLWIVSTVVIVFHVSIKASSIFLLMTWPKLGCLKYSAALSSSLCAKKIPLTPLHLSTCGTADMK